MRVGEDSFGIYVYEQIEKLSYNKIYFLKQVLHGCRQLVS